MLNGGIVSIQVRVRLWGSEKQKQYLYLLLLSSSYDVFLDLFILADFLSVSIAHRYHQAKASGQGAQSKSSSAHSSRSTSPGPHWRNDGIAPYKPDRRSLEPPTAPCASSSSTQPGRSQNPSVPAELDSGAVRTLLPRPPRDRSEPRHFNPLR